MKNSNDKEKVSIIVPIYNVEKYLADCVESVLTQSFSDYELILVDDGSPDNCPRICDDYAARDNRVRVIHKENGGLSAARNTGIQSAKGEYIVFLDGDDCLYENVLESVNSCIEKYDAPETILGNVYYWDGNNERLIVDNRKYVDQQETRSLSELNELYAADLAMLPWSACQSIYKRDFLIQNDLAFTEKLVGAEDVEFYLRAMKCVTIYRLTDIPFIKYRAHREGSIISTPNFASVYGQLRVFSQAYENAWNSLMRKYFANWYTNIVILVNRIENPEGREHCYAFMEEHKSILRHTSKNAKYIAAKMVWRIFGVRRGSDVLLTIKKIFKI